MLITLDDIRAARAALHGIIIETPLLPDERLSQELNASIWLKAECTQRSGSFKVRGAYTMISRLPPASRQRGVIAPSAGNHAQGVALAAQLLGLPATIVMPERAPLTKIMATRRLGAEVILHGATFDDAQAYARRLEAERGMVYVPAFDHEHVIAGQGTLGLEIAEALPDLSLIVVPIGGGGLISGIALALKAILPRVRIIGVQAAGCAPVPRSLVAGRPVAVSSVHTIADGIAVKRPGELTLPIIRDLVDDVVTVDDDAIARAIAHAVQHDRLVVEGAGAAGLAALISGQVIPRNGETVCVPLCGGNIDSNLLTRVLEQVAVRQGRYLLLKSTLEDRPGNLAPLLMRVAESGANVIDIFHRRAVWLAPLDRVGIELVLEVRDEQHGLQVVQHLLDCGYHVEREGVGGWPE
ncbi:threonine ammonia-lyase [Roseiflexus sp.]|uniref:threonine ammonia-lyase n=1 Tax=Roseiflexus sp. TaxID=2562120 RepID=UPI00398A8330